MDGNRPNLNPNALTVEQVATLLTNAYRQQIPASQIEADVDAGAPTNANGTINLVHYAAWLLWEMNRGD